MYTYIYIILKNSLRICYLVYPKQCNKHIHYIVHYTCRALKGFVSFDMYLITDDSQHSAMLGNT